MTIRGGVAALAIGAALASPMSARSDDLGTVSSLADDPVGTVTSTADEATGTVVSTASSALGAAATSMPIPNAVAGAGSGGATSSLSAGTGSDVGASGGTEASGGKAHHARSTARSKLSPGRSYHSRFDRLPRRTELLLERIELGRHVQTNLRRLHALLVRFPGLGARLERALDAELARLHRGGLTQTEREQVRRLARAREVLGTVSGALPRVGSPGTARVGAFGADPAGPAPDRATTPSASASAAEAHGGTRAHRDSSGSTFGSLPAQTVPDEWPPWAVYLLTALGWLTILVLVAVLVVQFTRILRAS